MAFENKYVVVGSRPWNRRVFDETISKYPGEWHFIGQREQLTEAILATIRPRYVFFLHWSWKVPGDITDRYECVNFHMTDVPYGKGGSPLQNLILRGHKTTQLTALRMTAAMDDGPVYLKREMNLDGSAQEIYIRSSRLAAEMILQLVERKFVPVPQQGQGVVFKRREPLESEIPELESPVKLYDFIRMLDADGYPQAFLVWRGYRFEFHDAKLEKETLTTKVKITKEVRR